MSIPNVGLTSEQTLQLLEVAKEALRDADIFDYAADKMDLSDVEMTKLSNAVEYYLENGGGGYPTPPKTRKAPRNASLSALDGKQLKVGDLKLSRKLDIGRRVTQW